MSTQCISVDFFYSQERAVAAGAYAEAVEKDFKVVRDRLRQLAGVETGSEAFDKAVC